MPGLIVAYPTFWLFWENSCEGYFFKIIA